MHVCGCFLPALVEEDEEEELVSEAGELVGGGEGERGEPGDTGADV